MGSVEPAGAGTTSLTKIIDFGPRERRVSSMNALIFAPSCDKVTSRAAAPFVRGRRGPALNHGRDVLPSQSLMPLRPPSVSKHEGEDTMMESQSFSALQHQRHESEIGRYVIRDATDWMSEIWMSALFPSCKVTLERT